MSRWHAYFAFISLMRKGQHRRLLIFLGVLALTCVAIILEACGGASSTTPATPNSSPAVPLSATEVDTVVQNAVLSVNVPIVVAVTDRSGVILAVFETPGAPTTATGNFGAIVDSRELAVSLARTGALFSNDQAQLSSRTVRFISGIHFP